MRVACQEINRKRPMTKSSKAIREFIVLCGLGLLFGSRLCGEPLEPARFPSLLSALRDIPALAFCGEALPMQNQEVRERLEKEFLLSLWDRPQVILWLKRSRRYLPHIEKLLQQHGMPDDLKYIAIVESALRAHAGSKKGAMGFWQFTTYTARKYGLEVNHRIDERRNLVASTQAAIRYLQELYTTFGSWTLVAAAYNMGEDGLMGEILEQDTTNYYQLYLPLETQRYIPRILAAKLIFSHPARYGFLLREEDYYPPLHVDRIEIQSPQDIPLRLVAAAAKTHFKTLKDLNPEIRGHYLPEGQRQILIPHGASKDFERRYAELLKQWLTERGEQIYVIQKGDTLSGIATRFNVPLTAILIWNRLTPQQPIHPGDELIIHRRTLP
jgi:membrane-bound lytic murein transglycosylase D